ncbi:thiamine biosynthetic bifunctional enzyme TH1, chloroplastic isoform X2 [Cicer arietinum]|uniref:thiamine biosynthetic bifunctional enzyme TH1, chloroplastic isoform X2 n=1 Tax=Cicer arietinum TaxID=3827 RepID=UPI003CC63563
MANAHFLAFNHLHLHLQISSPLVSKRVIKRFWNCDIEYSTNYQRPGFLNMKLQANGASIPTSINTADSQHNKTPHVLTVAGSDSGAGAGIQADLKACAARRVYCSTVITAVTAQNTLGVQGVNIVPEEFVAQQLNSVLSDMHVDVAALVVDPVMISTSGDILAGPSVLAGFREELLPMADIVTPNIKEASVLLGDVPMNSVSDMRAAAKLIHDLGPRSVLVKGGDLPNSSDAIDIFFDGENFYELRSRRVNTRNTHGTGCTMASCIAAELAKGSSMLSAVKIAKRFVETALDYSKDLAIGNGVQGPFDHFLALKNINQSSCRSDRFKPNDLFLYAVTDSRMNRKWGRSIAEAVKAAVEGGATIVQLREKDAETKDFVDAAKVCLKICHSYGVPLLINDRIDVALACDADGVHVGQSDMPVHLARSLLGPEKIIGVSCKTPEQAQQAWVDGADYIGSGGVYPTNTKENNRTIGLGGLKEVCKASKLPVVAIGGIGLSNARAVMEIGVPSLKGVAVVSTLFDRECISTETRNLHAVISEAALLTQ